MKRDPVSGLFSFETYPVEMLDLERAKTIVLDTAPVSARNSLHIITLMERHCGP